MQYLVRLFVRFGVLAALPLLAACAGMGGGMQAHFSQSEIASVPSCNRQVDQIATVQMDGSANSIYAAELTQQGLQSLHCFGYVRMGMTTQGDTAYMFVVSDQDRSSGAGTGMLNAGSAAAGFGVAGIAAAALGPMGYFATALAPTGSSHDDHVLITMRDPGGTQNFFGTNAKKEHWSIGGKFDPMNEQTWGTKAAVLVALRQLTASLNGQVAHTVHPRHGRKVAGGKPIS